MVTAMATARTATETTTMAMATLTAITNRPKNF
jgi:hypothetical protein